MAIANRFSQGIFVRQTKPQVIKRSVFPLDALPFIDSYDAKLVIWQEGDSRKTKNASLVLIPQNF